MVGEDRVMTSVKEFRRVHVIRQTMEKKLTEVKAGPLEADVKQIRRLIARVAQAYDHGVAHREWRKPSNW
jgi:hypothetical protein